MSYNYNYVRNQKPDGSFDINNPDRTDGNGDQILLAKEIESAFPAKIFKVICTGNNCDICFEDQLSESEKSSLDSIVNTHQLNS